MINVKVGQFIKIFERETLKQVHYYDDEYVECWCGGNLVKFKKEYIEYSVDVDHFHLRNINL